MATASKASNWTKEHEDALSGLRGLGISQKEGRQFLEALASENSGELMRKALAARSRSQKPPPNMPPGAPANAQPINPASPSQAPRPAPSPEGGFSAQMAGAPPPVRSAPPAAPPIGGGGAWSAASMAPQTRAPRAPIGPAAAQLQPASAPPPEAPKEKPRIRVRAAGSRIPPAPIGAETPSKEATSTTEAPQSPTAAAETPTKSKVLPLIHSIEEYNQLAPGTEFIWRSDGHIYEKPAEKGE